MGMSKASPLFIVLLKYFDRSILHRLEDFVNIQYSNTAGLLASLSNTLQVSKLLDCDQQFYSH